MSPAIDRAHLSAQTFGDLALQRDILNMFSDQAPPLLQALAKAAGAARSDIAHRLKGSALAIGATALADAARRLEEAPDDPALLHAIERSCAEVLREIGEITAG